MVTNPDARAALYQQAIQRVEAELERVNAALAAMGGMNEQGGKGEGGDDIGNHNEPIRRMHQVREAYQPS